MFLISFFINQYSPFGSIEALSPASGHICGAVTYRPRFSVAYGSLRKKKAARFLKIFFIEVNISFRFN